MDIYTKEKGSHSLMDDEYLCGEEPKLYKSEDIPETFHIGQLYEKDPAKKIQCALCGTDQLNVGMGSYFTAVRCPNCEWELCIHDG